MRKAAVLYGTLMEQTVEILDSGKPLRKFKFDFSNNTLREIDALHSRVRGLRLNAEFEVYVMAYSNIEMSHSTPTGRYSCKATSKLAKLR